MFLDDHPNPARWSLLQQETVGPQKMGVDK